jgi:hypothetical protein
MSYIRGRKIKHPGYSLKEEIFHAVSSGSWAALNMAESMLKDQGTADFYVLSRIRVITRVCILLGTFFCFWAVFRYLL